ncbi:MULTISPECIES: bifunctional diaminohydroxyphosphoribosylaminopyrimidine deaminase/5-amino-6-(5-phosphoribosylamino)uracil reductase RibD [Kordiimonas]|uniref:bifunctional diaminohydroxyphosphoribosylaminopyrimidine deaminase/5-amino-6-(5-phosphoribosylamino)uracil reductase RibD n=1 Tax=Kordiimonas TaxID=288021 RepID=UPI0025811C53|nr:bifunctional diaminohydroxyphosphoribosylaminopyrimidine deaminase/5-amino-6-(5-phosphoribosylamino)uracil reductase RibD [Kordiimonas sp. UBA4487]
MASTSLDETYMKAALGLARRGLGTVAPNPAVGCILVKDGIIIGRGWTQPGGRPHAETMALGQAGAAAKGATAYVTLEPCAHVGKTGPCAEALVNAGISRCVMAVSDPDWRVAGKGLAILANAGVETRNGVCEMEAAQLNRGFFLRVSRERPLFTVKIASTLDGRIALENGDSKWITGSEARRFGHMLRAQHDGILVGSGTVLADDPSLDCRLAGLEGRSPVPIILDGTLQLKPTHKLAQCAATRGTVVFHQVRDAAKEAALQKLGVETVAVEDTHDLAAVSAILAERGFTRVLVEGGGQVHASFLKAGFADRIAHFSAAKAIGADGRPAIGALDLASLGEAPHFNLETIRQLGPDILASYVKAE